MKRWNCPKCGKGALAPERPAKDDVRRFCLPCSGKTGKLVERVAPALERKRKERAEQAKAKAQAKRATKRARSALEREKRIEEGKVYPGVLRLLFDKWVGLKAWRANLRGLHLVVRRRRLQYSTGHAYYGLDRVVVTAGTMEGDGYATLLHELAHHAGDRRTVGKFDNHDRDFWRCLEEAAEEVLGRTIDWPPAKNRFVVQRKLAEEFQAEVEAGRLPRYGGLPPRRRVGFKATPMDVQLTAEEAEEVKDLVGGMEGQAEHNGDQELVKTWGWLRKVLEWYGWQTLPVRSEKISPSASYWRVLEEGLRNRGDDLAEPMYDRIADRIRARLEV